MSMMLPIKMGEELTVRVRNIHRHKLLNGTHRISTINTSGDLILTTRNSLEEVVPIIVVRNQIFSTNELQEGYYNRNRLAINMQEPPSYFISYIVNSTDIPPDVIIQRFITEGKQKLFPSSEYEFFGSLNPKRWFFTDEEVDMYESEVNDGTPRFGIQYSFENQLDSEVDNSQLCVDITQSLPPRFKVRTVEVVDDFWFKNVYITFNSQLHPSLEGDFDKTLRAFLNSKNFNVFSKEYLPDPPG